MRLMMELLPLPAGLAAVMFAQATPIIDSNIVSLVGNGVTVVVLAWYVIYDVRVRTPNMLKTFSLEQRRGRTAYRRTVESMRQAFLLEQSEMRKVFATEQAAARSHHATEQEALRKMAWDSIQTMGKAVHDVRGAAQGLISRLEDEVMAPKAGKDTKTDGGE
jgi:hypothetical protein